MTYEEFESLVSEALIDLPTEFKSKLDNVVITIEDQATAEQLVKLGIRHPLLLYGLYEGVPQTKRLGYSFIPPDKITIFKDAIEASFQTPEGIKEKVRAVVLHEIGHHFGMSDHELYQHKNSS